MSKKSLGYLTVITLVIIAVIVAVVVVPVMNFTNDHQYTITITDKERVTTQVAEEVRPTANILFTVKMKTERLMFSRTQIHCSDGNSIRLMSSVL